MAAMTYHNEHHSSEDHPFATPCISDLSQVLGTEVEERRNEHATTQESNSNRNRRGYRYRPQCANTYTFVFSKFRRSIEFVEP